MIETSVLTVEELNTITSKLKNDFSLLGFEFYPFKVAWYNDKVANVFHLNYNEDTVGYVVLSTPSMFERVFKPYIHQLIGESEVRDPLDQCMSVYIKQMKQNFSEHEIVAYRDFDMTPMRRPKILMQTAGHVSGAAYFYQRSDLINDPWNNESVNKIFGVSLHPKYGGWFGFRAVLIFSNVQCPSLEFRLPIDMLPSDEQKIDLLEKFNFHWQDWQYRDVIPAEERYSEDQKMFFASRPCDRFQLINKWKLQSNQEACTSQF